jgi:hypothetical protein
MIPVEKRSLPRPPPGFHYYTSEEEILRAPTLLAYQHLLLRAWKEMNLSGVMTLDGIPTVYVRDEKRPLSATRTADVHRRFWNQGLATVLVLRDPTRVRVFSSLSAPLVPAAINNTAIDSHAVEIINLADLASWAHKFYIQLGNGHYYTGDRARHFNPREGVDAYLLDNLTAVRDELAEGPSRLLPSLVHAFLGRILFTCYLCDRGIIQLSNYFPNKQWKSLRDLFITLDNDAVSAALYGKLFPKLKNEFNSSLFDDDLSTERGLIQPAHLNAIRGFLNGDPIRKEQRSLGFWAYNFKFIPIETISAIYESFLEKEDENEKRQSGAYYTPRFLAEMTLDIALEGATDLRKKHYVDPACGSGIFLVLLFKRLAAEWRSTKKRRPPAAKMAVALRGILSSLRGIDKNLTACRIACFSLYIAYLDQFHPPEVQDHMRVTGAKLPNLLDCKDPRKKKADIPVIWNRDFFSMTGTWKGQFDIVIGNPPWVGRGTKQIAHEFMVKAPALATTGGRVCLILPSKVFFNRTDDFQSKWLQSVTLQRLVQLADYRFILFRDAKCPCAIALFTNETPDIANHEVEYVTPKVSCLDLRDGVIPVSPADRKWIALQYLLDAAKQEAISVAWKSSLWGTRRDAKLLRYLFTLPRLSDIAGEAEEVDSGKKRWVKGQGFQPLSPTSTPDENPQPLEWDLDRELFVTPDMLIGLFTVPQQIAIKLREHFKAKKYRTDFIHRARSERIYEPPFVLLNQGFTTSAYFDYCVRFKAALQSIAGPSADANTLLFLTAFLKSKVARYFAFHTAGNLGTERDKVHVVEFLRLPFFLPDDPVARIDAEAIVAKVAEKILALKAKNDAEAKALAREPVQPVFRLRRTDEGTDEAERAEAKKKLLDQWTEESRALQTELEPLIYAYFDLGTDEVALIEDTCNIFDPSATPHTLEAASRAPTMAPIVADDLEPYANVLTSTLANWSSNDRHIVASGDVDDELGIAILKLEQAPLPSTYERASMSKDLSRAMQRLKRTATEDAGHLAYLRDTWFFDGPRIYLVKSALRGQWTRTAALNDATDIHATIAETRSRMS